MGKNQDLRQRRDFRWWMVDRETLHSPHRTHTGSCGLRPRIMLLRGYERQGQVMEHRKSKFQVSSWM